MKIELLYFEGCPNHKTALTNVREALLEAGVEAQVDLIRIETPQEAAQHRFLGSPSIRIDDQDLEISENESTEYSMRCRLYRNGDVTKHFPSKELIAAKISTMIKR